MWRNEIAPRRPRCAKRGGGFTLIELLVALAIFALMSGFAYRALDTMLQSRQALEKESRKWRDVTLFVGRVERDLAAVLARRRATSASGTPLAPVSSTVDAGAAGVGLAITRSGSPLQENALAAPQRIAYRLDQSQVVRLAWTSVDAAPRDEPAAVPVLHDVRALEFRFLDPRGEWRATWGLPGSGETAPAAVEMRLELASGERIVRLVDLPQTTP
ncbi:MAG TPA: type II secretion system minor pseudopilin GspJ [Usitatibacter sp.]|nr:type II secretion system minor pseudopilin GspJ [Usitatibacter sp.]